MGALILHFVRRNNGVRAAPSQWYHDALNLVSILLLVLICARAVFGNVFGLDLNALTSSNGIIILSAFVNCIMTIIGGIRDSLRNNRR